MCVCFFGQSQLPPLSAGKLIEHTSINRCTCADTTWAFRSSFTFHHSPQTSVDVAIKDRHLIVAVTGKAFNFFTFDLKRTLVFFNAVAVEYTHFNDRTEITRLNAQGCVTNVRRFFTKDSTEEFFLWCHRAFAFWCDLTNKDITGLYFSTDINDTRFVEVAQGFLTDVWNIACDFLWPKLRVTCGDFEFLNVDRGEDVVTYNTLRDQNGVFVVVPVPRHKRDDHVFTQCQITDVCRWTISNNFALQNCIAHFNQRTLVDAGVLVGTLEFTHAVNINARITNCQVRCRTNNDTCCIDLVDNTGTFRHDRSAGIPCNDFFDTCTNQRRFGL